MWFHHVQRCFPAQRKVPFVRNKKPGQLGWWSEEWKALRVKVKGRSNVTPSAWRHCSGYPLALAEKENEPLKKKKQKKNQSLFNRGLNYANPIIVINCWENSALIAPKQQAQLYTALM